jgi:hypothetical protein
MCEMSPQLTAQPVLAGSESLESIKARAVGRRGEDSRNFASMRVTVTTLRVMVMGRSAITKP